MSEPQPFDLHRLTLDELQRLESLVHVELRARQEREKRALVRKLSALAESEKISLEKLYADCIAGTPQAFLARSASPDLRRGPRQQKYRSPDGLTTWSGRGRKPLWVTKHIEAGKPLEDLLTEGWKEQNHE